MDRILDYLSDYVTSLDYNQIPADAVEKTKGLIVDTIGCALGGYDSFPSQVAVDLAQSVTSKQPATVLVNGHSTTPDLAAFANGVMIRYLDFNDGYTSIDSGHPSDAIAAVLPLAEMRHATGREFIASTVLAYETFCRLCDAVEVRNRGYDHVTLGVISAGVGAARALGLDKEKTAQAISLSLVPNVSLHQTRIGTVSMWKGCAFANASRNAVFAAQLAEKGLTGPADIFDGREGFGKVITGDLIELAPFGGGETPFKVSEVSIKRFPLGLYSQTVMEAALKVRERLSGVDDIEEIHVSTLGAAVRIMAGDQEKWRPATRETADHSMPYTVAVMLKYGDVGVERFDDAYLNDPALLDLVQRVKVSVSEEANRCAPEAMLCNIEVTTKSGERIESGDVPFHRGHWRNPMDRGEIDSKFRALADGVLPKDRTEALLETLWRLEEAPDIADVVAMIRA